jgi:hypothetical protein
MTYQAIHPFSGVKIETVVFPTIPCVTTCATRLVADDAHSVVVQGRGSFTVLHRAGVFGGIG